MYNPDYATEYNSFFALGKFYRGQKTASEIW